MKTLDREERRLRANGYRTHEPLPDEALKLKPHFASTAIVELSIVTGVLGAISAAVGLVWRGGGGGTTAITFLGEEVDLYGRGLYENDTFFFAANNFATDLVLLVLGVPLLAISLWMFARGSLRARLVLLGTLGFFLYYGSTYALGGVAYNELFLLYVAIFSTGLFAFVKTFASFDRTPFAGNLSDGLPTRLPGIFMLVSAVATAAIWLMDPVGALLSGDMPKGLETHTTLFTHAFDLAIIVPAAFVAGVMILRRRAFGYVVAFSLLILEAFLLPIISIATLIQLDLGVEFEPADIVGPIAGFGVLAGFALWVITSILRRVSVAETIRREVAL